MKRIWIVLVCLAAVLPGIRVLEAKAHEGEIHANDMDQKTLEGWLKKLYPKASGFKLEHVGLPDAGKIEKQVKAVGAELTGHDYHPPIYIAVGSGGRSLGFAFFTIARDNSDLVVAMDAKAGVLKVLPVKGPAVKLPPAFLEQFRGKALTAPFTLGKNIQPKGAAPATVKTFAATVKKAQIIGAAWLQSKQKTPHGGGHAGH